MARWMLLVLSLGLGTQIVACQAKAKDEKSEKADKDDDDDDSSSKKKKKHKEKDDEEDEDSGKKGKKEKADKEEKATKVAGDKPAKDVDAKALLEDQGGESSDVLEVKLPDDVKDAPSLGGAAVPVAAPSGPALTWMSAGPLAVPNPGWTRVDDGPVTVLLSPDKKAAIVFAPFTTTQDGTAKVDRLVQKLKLAHTSWKKAKPVTLGSDKIPALLGSGRATGPDGKPVKLYFALVKSGAAQNLLAIGVADGDAPATTIDTGLRIVSSIKRQR